MVGGALSVSRNRIGRFRTHVDIRKRGSLTGTGAAQTWTCRRRSLARERRRTCPRQRARARPHARAHGRCRSTPPRPSPTIAGQRPLSQNESRERSWLASTVPAAVRNSLSESRGSWRICSPWHTHSRTYVSASRTYTRHPCRSGVHSEPRGCVQGRLTSGICRAPRSATSRSVPSRYHPSTQRATK